MPRRFVGFGASILGSLSAEMAHEKRMARVFQVDDRLIGDDRFGAAVFDSENRFGAYKIELASVSMLRRMSSRRSRARSLSSARMRRISRTSSASRLSRSLFASMTDSGSI